MGHCILGNKVFCSIRLSAKAEAEEVADCKAHKREVGGEFGETVLPVPGVEHLVKAGSGALPVLSQQLLSSIQGASRS